MYVLCSLQGLQSHDWNMLFRFENKSSNFFFADGQCSCTAKSKQDKPACLFSVACGVSWLGGSFQRLQVARLEIIVVRAAARGLSEAFSIS